MRALLVAVALLLAGCRAREERQSPDAGEPPPVVSAPEASAPPPPPRRASLTVLAGGDISFGRLVGQMLLKDPSLDFFARLRPWLSSVDVRFANLEGPISDQKGETVKPDQVLVFTGPPAGAPALARARFDVVSTANNHAWDYGKEAMLETLTRLDAAGVQHAGTGIDREAARRATIVERDGFKVAFLAVTDIWNQGPLEKHPGDAFVARADKDLLVEAVRGARASADAVLVSYHGGVEYTDEPLVRTREMLRAAIDAGADAVLGHHPHVVQGVEWYEGRPILYSFGNLLMRMANGHDWTQFGYLARLELRRGEPPRVEACPFRIFGTDLRPFAGDPQRAMYERLFFDHLRNISVTVGRVAIAPPGEDGCARLSAVEGTQK